MHPELLSDLAVTLGKARDLGVAHVEHIAREEHARYGLSYDDCLTYLRDHLHFTLGPRELAGLRLFQQLAGTKLGPGTVGVSPAPAEINSLPSRRDACGTTT